MKKVTEAGESASAEGLQALEGLVKGERCFHAFNDSSDISLQS